jgi:hypothetical protein
MKTVSRNKFAAVALAAVLMGAVSLPALATETAPAVSPGTHPAAGTEAVRPNPAKPAGTPAAMTEKAGSHASATTGAPGPATPGQAPATPKTN